MDDPIEQARAQAVAEMYATLANPMHFARSPAPHASEDKPVTTDDLVRQILAAIDELEAAALAARDAPADMHVIMRPGAPQPTELEKLALKTRLEREDRERRRRADPARALLQEQGDWDTVLRHCTADRRLLELHRQVIDGGHDSAWPAPGHCAVCGAGDDYEPFPCATVRLRAEAYGVAPATGPADQQEAH